MFKKLEGDTAMLRQGGVYRPCELYSWNGGLFAKMGSGYIRLRQDGTTTKDGVSLEHMEIEGDLFADKFGRLATERREGYTALTLTTGEVLQITKATETD